MIFDATNSYLPAWWAAIGVLLVGATLLSLTPKPRPAASRALEAV